ncbi:Z1 domain-containing protein [Kocuria sp. CPCC 205258]|uniref:Z1 domain-containing protein n=1 Tax=Kocuria sp. CPCC 205258 TaxID=3073552 RepID=UPI0034D6A93B
MPAVADEIDDLYEDFVRLLEIDTPEGAVKMLRRWKTDEETISGIQERHEAEVLKIRELEEPRTVVTDGRDTWYTGPKPGDVCWPAVAHSLKRDGWTDDSLESLDRSSTRIVSLLNHPKEKSFQTRGLVVGYVQSGKTTSFTSVIAKAVDRGYKLVIVLAGIHNGLRRQTQVRLVQQLVEPNPARWTQLTELDHDFTPPANPAAFFGAQNKTHVLCVVKKNATVLRKLSKWLDKAGPYLKDCATLVIDDEADQATVATKSINPLIRGVLDSLPKSVYLAYTASPFANLLIDPSDPGGLYPRDFIVNLPKPEGHFGTEVLFGRESIEGESAEDVDDGYDMIRSIPETEEPLVRPMTRAEVEGFEPEITGTLKAAVEYFWLATAARLVRGAGKKHSTMLIHTSVNTSVHDSFRAPLVTLRAEAVQSLGDPDYRRHLRELWDTETSHVPAEDFGEKKVEFEELEEQLPAVLARCRVIMDNSNSQDRLDYDNGPVIAIAVGGNTLSRGLTLEGLAVSYFVRAVSAYDTLLQMGRWFGFRHGYADLPRIWMTDELARWFRHLATVEAEMRRDIDVYMTEDKSPLDFAVRLRTHPALQVTAAAKMKAAVKAASSYGGQRVQTHYFDLTKERLEQNIEAARSFVRSAENQVPDVDTSRPGRFVYRGVPYEDVLRFLDSYAFHPDATEGRAKLLKEYIDKRVVHANALRRWNLVLLGNAPTADEMNFSFSETAVVGLVNRAKLKVSDQDPYFADIKTLMSRHDAVADLPTATPGMSEKEIVAHRRKNASDIGLIVLYPIDKDSRPAPGREDRRLPLGAPEHVIGVGMVFPRPSGADDAVEYEYVSADLSRVRLEEEDLSLLEAEE